MYGDGNHMPPPMDHNGSQGNGTYYYNDDGYNNQTAVEDPYHQNNNNGNVIYEDEEDYNYDGTISHDPNYSTNSQPNYAPNNQPLMNSHNMYPQQNPYQEQYQQPPPPPMMNAPSALHNVPNQMDPQQYHQHQSEPDHYSDYASKSQSKDREKTKKQRENRISSSSSSTRASKSHRNNGNEGKKQKKPNSSDKKNRKEKESRSKSHRDDKSVNTRNTRKSAVSKRPKRETPYEADFEAGKRGKPKKKMSLVKKVAISGTVVVVCIVVAVAALVFTRTGNGGKKNPGGNGIVSQPSTSGNNVPTPASRSPTKWPTMEPTFDVPSIAPSSTQNRPSEPVLCPSVQELIGTCVRDSGGNTDDMVSSNNNNNNVNNVPAPSPGTPSFPSTPTVPTPSSSSRTLSPTRMTPTVSNQNNNINAPCPTIQFIIGTCGTRSPTLPPQTRAPVVQVPAENICTRDKFQNKIFINEFHYKNQAFDFAEFVELVHSTDLNLSGYALEFYDGISGQVYKRTELGNTIPAVTSSDPNGGSVTFSAYSQVSFHDGPAGIALIDPSGNVVQFLGYGDPTISNVAFTAVNGFASGMTPSFIGVFEPEDSPLTYSLQLNGAGSDNLDFQWQEPDFGTPGKINGGQVFLCD